MTTQPEPTRPTRVNAPVPSISTASATSAKVRVDGTDLSGPVVLRRSAGTLAGGIITTILGALLLVIGPGQTENSFGYSSGSTGLSSVGTALTAAGAILGLLGMILLAVGVHALASNVDTTARLAARALLNEAEASENT